MQRSFRSTPLIIITGPTASGKSGLGTLLAEAINGVIINGDMAQMYEPLTIGTAKPAWRQERVPHLLFDSICEPRDSSALEFREKATQAVRDVVAAGGVPIVVGGSFFHISTLFFKLDDGSFGSSSQGSSRTSNEVDKPSPEETQRLWHKLAAIDSKRASQIDRHDSYRIARALALAEHKTPSECAPQFDPIYNNCMLIHLTRDRAELYERINERVSVMLADGWLKEVRDLDSSWRSWLRQKKIIGYDTLLDCLESAEEAGGTVSKDAVQVIQQKTRNYAKRQLTFWRSFEKKLRAQNFHNIIECDLTLLSIDLYLEKILAFLEGMKETNHL